MIRPDEIAQIVVGILSVQSVYALVLFPLIWGMVKCCKGKYPGWQHGFWLLILLRLVLPPDIASPWSVSHLIRSAAPIMTSQSFLSFSSKPPVSEANQKSSIATPSKGHIPHIPDTQTLPELIPAIDNSPALVPFPTLLRGGYLIIFCSWLAVVGFLLLQFLRICQFLGSPSGHRCYQGGKTDQKRTKAPRAHGRHVLNRYEDGMEKCIGCELCAGVCPANCIYVRGADNDPESPTSPG